MRLTWNLSDTDIEAAIRDKAISSGFIPTGPVEWDIETEDGDRRISASLPVAHELAAVVSEDGEPCSMWQAFTRLVKRKPRSWAVLTVIKRSGVATMSEVVAGAGLKAAQQVSGIVSGFAKNAAASGVPLAQVLTSRRDNGGQIVYSAGPLLMAAEDV